MNRYKQKNAISVLRFLALFVVAVFLLASFAHQAHAKDERKKIFNAESFMLDNGMQVVVIPNHRAPVVTHMVWYRVGAIDELPGQSGIAHFVEHLMFKGSPNVAPGEFSRKVRALGGSDNAFTSQDYTAYFQSISKDHLELMMTMEADRMTDLLFPPKDVVSEQSVVLEERRQRTENDPRGYFFEQMRAALFPNHPYANPVIGWLHEVDALTEYNVKSFYKNWYAPNNAILIVSGDVTAEELKPMAEKTYGQIPAKIVPQRQISEVPPFIGESKLVLKHKTIRQPLFARIYRVPSYKQSKEEALALQVLEVVLAGDSTSRFYEELVKEKRMATSISMGYSSSGLSDAQLSITAAPASNVAMEELEWAIDDVLKDFIKNGVSDSDLGRAKSKMIDQAVFSRDSLSGPAMIFGRALTTGSEIDDIEYWPYLIEAVTAQQVQDVAEKHLNPEDFAKRPPVTGYLLPEDNPEPVYE